MEEEKVKWEYYKGRKILVVDYSNLEGKVLIDTMTRVTNFIINSHEGNILMLIDAASTKVNLKVILKSQETMKQIKSQVVKIGVFGAPMVRKIIFSRIQRKVAMKVDLFKNKTEALEWLIIE